MARGGKRKGAGRPKGDPDERFKRVSLTVSPDVLALIDAFALEHKMSRSAAVEELARLGLQQR
jgi:metal-responsive CopG/Arc/MetJ family transcriptional regulator